MRNLFKDGGNNMRHTSYNTNNGGNNMRHTSFSIFANKNVYKPVKKHTAPKKVALPDGTYRARINTSDMYIELKAAINTRHQLDAEMKRRWSEIKRGYARKVEMESITKRIGNQTHKIDSIIHKLTRCKNQPAAIKLATDFLVGERNRTEHIINHNNQLISQVRKGQTGLINSDGHHHHDPSGLIKYVEIKRRRLQQINSLLYELKR